MLNRAAQVGGAALIVAATGLLHTAVGTRDLWTWLGPASMLGLLGIALLAWGRVRVRTVLVLAVALRVGMATAPGLVLSDDLYRYVWDGRVAASGASPYAYSPNAPELAALRDSAVYAPLNSKAFYSVYPPVSQAVFRVAGEVDRRWGATAALWTLRLVGMAAELLALLLLARLVPTGAALALYALHPLVLVEAGQGHTELYALPLLSAGFFVLRASRSGVATAAWMLAGAVKLVPFLLLPLAWIGRSASELRRSVLVAAGLGILFMWTIWPYAGHVLESLRLYASYFEFNAPLYLGLKRTLGSWLGGDTGPFAARLLLAGFGLVYAGILVVQARSMKLLLPIKNNEAKTGLVVWAGFLASATTVHPWYLLPVLLMAAASGGGRLAWGVAALAAASMGSYEHYTTGTDMRWSLVGWSALGVAALAEALPVVLGWVLRRRAETKADVVEAAVGPVKGAEVLDLGAGEGYVGDALARRGADVTLADVADFHRVGLPFVPLDPRLPLPFVDDRFDVVVLMFVLHHAEDPVHTLREALRVGRRVVVLESVFDTEPERRLLDRLDRLANRLRSPFMRDQEPHLAFRTAEAWADLARSLGATASVTRRGKWLHKQAVLVLDPRKEARY